MAKNFNKPTVEVLITGNDSQFKTVAKNVTSELKKMAKDGSLGVLALGAAFTAVGVWMKDTLDTMDQISKMSQKTGFSVESLSALKYAAELAGVPLEALEKSFIKMNKAVDENNEAFKRINVSLVDSDGKLRKNDKILLDVAERFKGMEDGARKTAIATDIFGKAGADMIPLLNTGKEGITKLTDEAERLGITFDTKAAQKAEAFNDAITTLTNSGKGLVTEFTVSLLPVINDLTDKLNATARGAGSSGTALTPLQAISRGVAAGFYILYNTFMITANAISLVVIVVKDAIVFLGNLMKMLTQFGKGDFAGGMDTWSKLNFSDTATMFNKVINQPKKIFNDLKSIAHGETGGGGADIKVFSGEGDNIPKETKKKDIYTVEEKLKDLYKEKSLLTDNELEKAEIELSLKSQLYDLAIKNNLTEEERVKIWLELLTAQTDYVKKEEEERKRKKEEREKEKEEEAEKREWRITRERDSRKKLKDLEDENSLSGVPDWMKEQKRAEIEYQKELKEIELGDYTNKEALKAEVDLKYANIRHDIEKNTQEANLGVVSDTLNTASGFLQKHTLAYKALAIAQATIDTYLGASKALASLPPPFGAIAMGAVIAQGLANVATIAGIEMPGYATGGFAMVGEKGPEIIAPVQDYASGQAALISAVVNKMGSGSIGGGVQKFQIRGDDLVTVNDRNKYIRSKKAW